MMNIQAAIDVLNKIQSNYVGMNKSYQRVKFCHLREILDALKSSSSPKQPISDLEAKIGVDRPAWSVPMTDIKDNNPGGRCPECDLPKAGCICKPIGIVGSKAWSLLSALEKKEVTDSNDRLLKMITLRMEEFGMPKFKDNYPALDILQIVKDSGYSRNYESKPDLVPLNKKELMNIFKEHEIMSNEQLVDYICERFGQPKPAFYLPSESELSEIICIWLNTQTTEHLRYPILAKAIRSFLEERMK